jgi:hypothetical protein
MQMKPEHLRGYICGINKAYEILIIGVFRKDNSVRLLGPNGAHMVHSSNNYDVEGYKREAALVWGLTDMIDVARDKLDSKEVVERIALLKKRAADRKAAAEERAAQLRK